MLRFESSVYRLLLQIAIIVTLCGGRVRAEATTAPSTEPVVVDVKDKAAIDAAMPTVIITGKVSEAAWSPSGKVMKINFEGTEETHLIAVLFQASREEFDKAFDGDVSKSLGGENVQITGKLQDYNGQPEIVLKDPAQLTIIKADAAAPAAPADAPKDAPAAK